MMAKAAGNSYSLDLQSPRPPPTLPYFYATRHSKSDGVLAPPCKRIQPIQVVSI